jgi:hypothetical protein
MSSIWNTPFRHLDIKTTQEIPASVRKAYQFSVCLLTDICPLWGEGGSCLPLTHLLKELYIIVGLIVLDVWRERIACWRGVANLSPPHPPSTRVCSSSSIRIWLSRNRTKLFRKLIRYELNLCTQSSPPLPSPLCAAAYLNWVRLRISHCLLRGRVWYYTVMSTICILPRANYCIFARLFPVLKQKYSASIATKYSLRIITFTTCFGQRGPSSGEHHTRH